jgi:CRISPR type III-A-associated RAMP protein Csm4
MNPGLVVKLHPTGPWRIGPDSGARNRVDVIYHSDSMFAAVTSAMARLGCLDEWLDETARRAAPAVCFSSCFPFLDEIGFVVPPRNAWPPSSPAVLAARVRWKSARFVPLGIVPAILASQTLDENQWAIDGPSACLVPAGRPGPFRMDVRWNAAVDRMTGAAERHSTACLEFRPGAGLWLVVSFADEAARARWSSRVRAAFRWLADSGFGGERSRGWGRAEAPEFVEGMLPEMILGAGEKGIRDQGSGVGESSVVAAGPDLLPVPSMQGIGDPESSIEESAVVASGPDVLPGPPAGEPEEPLPVPPLEEPPAELPVPDPEPEPLPAAPPEIQSAPEPSRTPDPLIPDPRSLTPGSFWLLSLFSPAATDTIDWSRGNYSAVTRAGRVESPARSGELKKQVQMVAEGSVLFAAAPPLGSAPDVAPEGFPHPVFRAGFALAIPLPGPEGAAL